MDMKMDDRPGETLAPGDFLRFNGLGTRNFLDWFCYETSREIYNLFHAIYQAYREHSSLDPASFESMAMALGGVLRRRLAASGMDALHSRRRHPRARLSSKVVETFLLEVDGSDDQDLGRAIDKIYFRENIVSLLSSGIEKILELQVSTCKNCPENCLDDMESPCPFFDLMVDDGRVDPALLERSRSPAPAPRGVANTMDGTDGRDMPTGMEGPAILQVKVSVEGIKPPVWRRLLIRDDSTFKELHEAIVEAFGPGMVDGKHSFSVGRPGRRGERGARGGRSDKTGLPGDGARLGDFLNAGARRARYVNDACPGARFLVYLEKVLPPDPDCTRPVQVKAMREWSPTLHDER